MEKVGCINEPFFFFFPCWAIVHSQRAKMVEKNILFKDILFYCVGGGGCCLL